MDEIELLYPADGVAVVALQGEHDLATKREMAALLSAEIARNRVVIVDVSDAVMIDSSFIHTLERADRIATIRGSRFVLQMGTAPIVRRALEISGLLDRLSIAYTREEAIGPAVAPPDPTESTRHPR
jgi:anti-anti-sigma factor